MAGVGDKTDLTANLPDELLSQLLSYLPLRDKLSLEAVSRRFQRIILDLLRRPQSLDVDTYSEKSLNGYKVPLEKLCNALWALASKSKFSQVDIQIASTWEKRSEPMNSILCILLVTNCLDKVVSFQCNCAPSQDILETFLARCVKLSSLTLDFVVQPAKSGDAQALDLHPALNTLALEHLDLRLAGYASDQLIELFGSLKPKTLQKLSLMFYEEVEQMPPLGMAQVVKELSTNAWAALQDLSIGWREITTVHIDLAKFFDSLSLLRSLNECCMFFELVYDVKPANQFVRAMTSLFKSDIKLSVSSHWSQCILRSTSNNFPDCQAVAPIRQLQNVHPNMKVDFSSNDCCPLLKLSMGDGLFEELVDPESCGVVDCLECHRFYPMVLHMLARRADDCMDSHLESYQLDSCRVDTLVDRLNDDDGLLREWRALTAEPTEAGDLLMVSFEASENETQMVQYKISVACGRCFNDSCVRCLNID